MIMVTENAKRHLKRLLVKNTSDPNLGIRLRVGTGMQVGVLLDRKTDDDYVVEHEGAKVLMIGPELFPLVDDATLDTQRNGPITGLTITKERQQPSKKGKDTTCVKWDTRAGT